jgi:hypothetical protein
LKKTWAGSGDGDVDIVYYYGDGASTRVEGDRIFFPTPEGFEM